MCDVQTNQPGSPQAPEPTGSGRDGFDLVLAVVGLKMLFASMVIAVFGVASFDGREMATAAFLGFFGAVTLWMRQM
jgi:hypothetical protein